MYRAVYLLLILCNTFFASAEYKEVTFIQATPEEVSNSLSNTGRYSLVFFTADWCLPCQVLHEGHFRDERIINLINNGLLSVKADYSDRKDIDWYQNYEVRILPTLLILDDQGNEVDRIQNIKTTRELYLFLHQYSELPKVLPKPMAYKLETEKENNYNSFHSKSNKEVAHITSPSRSNKVKLVSNTTIIKKNIYEVDVEEYQSDLSIQFAAYTRYGNALKYLNTLRQQGMPVSILEEYVKGKKYYKVVQRANKSNIRTLYHRYQSEGKECFIRPAKVRP